MKRTCIRKIKGTEARLGDFNSYLEEEVDFATDALYSREVNVGERERNNSFGKERSRKQLKTLLITSHVSHAHVAVAITICMIVWSS